MTSTETNPRRRAVGYVRASTEEQQLSPHAQRAALERWCTTHDVELVAVHVDQGVSGATPVDQRPGLLAALDALGELEADVLLVQRRDRLARDVVIAAVVETWARRSGAQVLACDGPATAADDPSAWLLRTITDVMAQYERLLIAHRTRAALAVKRARGEHTGGHAPLGQRVGADGIQLEVDPDERAALERMRQLRAAGESIRGIAAALDVEGFPARGSRWHPTTVARMLRRTGDAAPA